MTRKVYDEDLRAGGRLGIFLDSALSVCCLPQTQRPDFLEIEVIIQLMRLRFNSGNIR